VNELVAAECDKQAVIEGVLDSLHTLEGEKGAAIKEEASERLEIQQDERHVARWKEKVFSIVKEIESGAVDKLVLARSMNVHSPQQFDPGVVLQKLRVGYSHCTLFAFASKQRCFVGATPERLLRLKGRTARTDCLAGSTRRGATADEDQALGEALLADRKERREHALVMLALRNVLEPLCARLSTPETPSLLRLPNVQHLHTPIKGELREASDIFTLVAALHPTPATGGLPQETACPFLRTYEDFDRGWYAGPVGWVDGQGGGEFAVAIRSALLHGREARLYAGCGIVEGSDPEREYAESCLKLRPMLWALNSTQT
jgi:isochorismate synthase